ncbi:MAG: hypothetical protein IJL72_01055, partial [Lachnospiraceae bacterium]|nr:hypothetical protein [Lachnospiraceae bacterium]
LSSGFRVTILTVVLASAAALIRPLPDGEEDASAEDGNQDVAAEGRKAEDGADPAVRKGGRP